MQLHSSKDETNRQPEVFVGSRTNVKANITTGKHEV